MRGWRRYPALYLLALFLGAAAAPHHHLDPIADLLSDRPSNSGTFALIQGPGSLETGFFPGLLVQDVSCFACFQHDFVTSPAVALSWTTALRLYVHHPVPFSWSVPTVFVSGTSSRGPPSAS